METKKTSDAKRRSNAKYDAEHIKFIGLKVKKEFAARIDEGARREGLPRARFITNAVLKELDRMGVPEQAEKTEE